LFWIKVEIRDSVDEHSPEKDKLMSIKQNHDVTTQESQYRLIIRYIAAAISAVIAIVYFLIGFRIVSVLNTPENQTFGIAAGGMFVFGAVLLLAFDNRLLWIFGAALQMMIIFVYFNVAPMRIPSYEAWGILIRVAQVGLLISLLYLAARPSFEDNITSTRREEV
jgi:hypothetical protein